MTDGIVRMKEDKEGSEVGKVPSFPLESLFCSPKVERVVVMTESSRCSSRFSKHEQIQRLAVVGMLVALGYLLMLLGKVQQYPLASFLELEVSDTIVLVAYSLYGFGASLAVSVLKALLCMLTFGPVGSPIPIGNLTAIFTSLAYSFGLLILDKCFHIFSKNRWFRYLGYVFIILFVSGLLTFLNYLFITPTFLVYGSTFVTAGQVKQSLTEVGNTLGDTFRQLFGRSDYGLTIFIIYFPFNLIKGTLVCLTYELIFNRVIFHLLKSGRFKNRIFMKKSELPDPEDNGGCERKQTE